MGPFVYQEFDSFDGIMYDDDDEEVSAFFNQHTEWSTGDDVALEEPVWLPNHAAMYRWYGLTRNEYMDWKIVLQVLYSMVNEWQGGWL